MYTCVQNLCVCVSRFLTQPRYVQADIGTSHVTQRRESRTGYEGEKQEEEEKEEADDHMVAANCQMLGKEVVGGPVCHVHSFFWEKA